MAETQPQFGFLTTYVEKVLESAGVVGLSQDIKQLYLPQFVAEAEYRLGLALQDKLSDEAIKEFGALIDNETAGSEAWLAFWKKSVPDFDAIVEKTLLSFADEMKAALAV